MTLTWHFKYLILTNNYNKILPYNYQRNFSGLLTCNKDDNFVKSRLFSKSITFLWAQSSEIGSPGISCGSCRSGKIKAKIKKRTSNKRSSTLQYVGSCQLKPPGKVKKRASEQKFLLSERVFFFFFLINAWKIILGFQL